MTTKTTIVCLIYSATLNSDVINVISKEENSLSLPQIDVSDLNPKKHDISLDTIIKILFNKSVNLNFSWAKPKLLNIELIYDEENDTTTTAIYYGIYIPNNVQLNDRCYWIDIKPYIGHYETLRKLVCML